VALNQAGISVNRIALNIKSSVRTVSGVWRRFLKHRDSGKKAMLGRAKKTTRRDDRMLN